MSDYEAAKHHTVVGVTAIVRDGDRVLLGLKGRAVDDSLTGKWVTPGGRINYAEPLWDALVREVKEETGLRVMLHGLLSPQEFIHPKGHFVFVVYEASPCGGEVQAGDDLTHVQWFTHADLQRLVCSDDMTPMSWLIVMDYLSRR